MSQENVDLNHQANDAFNRRDLYAFLALMDQDVEFIPYEVAVQGGDPYRGHDGVRRWWEETLSVLPDIRVETYEIRDLGARNFVHGRLCGHGAGSGAPIERPLWQVTEWRDQKTVWWGVFESEADALEAAGLRE
jgi:ketosteroid isomerase-like protein